MEPLLVITNADAGTSDEESLGLALSILREHASVEVQATAERTPLSRASLDELLALAEDGIARLREAQESALGALPA